MSKSVIYRAALAAFGSMMLVGAAHAATVDITTDADAYVSGFPGSTAPTVLGDQSNTNYGSDTSLYTQYAAASGYTSPTYPGGVPENIRTLIKFALPNDFGTATAANLTLNGSASVSTWTMVYGVGQSQEGWTESGVTWNNAPGTNGIATEDPDTTNLTTLDDVFFASGTYTLDTTSALVAFLNTDTNKSVSFLITNTYFPGGTVTFTSKEGAGANVAIAPTLHLTYTPAPVPEPASLSLLALGGLALLRRRRSAV